MSTVNSLDARGRRKDAPRAADLLFPPPFGTEGEVRSFDSQATALLYPFHVMDLSRKSKSSVKIKINLGVGSR